jgi:hypothetical protein
MTNEQMGEMSQAGENSPKVDPGAPCQSQEFLVSFSRSCGRLQVKSRHLNQ